MNKKTLLILLGVLLVLFAGIFIFKKTSQKVVINDFTECVAAGNLVMESYPRICRVADGTLFTEEISPSPTPTPHKSDLIRVFNPEPDQIITSPIILSGEARGNWFFEASFPGELLDQNGKVVATFIAQAQGEWMTSEFVPFRSTLEFKNPGTDRGTLVFKKDNPSGLPEHDDEYRIPVRFAPTSNLSLKAYFSNQRLNPDDTVCTNTYPVTRVVGATSAPARAAILELLEGVSENEKEAGYMTSINDGVTLQKISIVEGTAFVDFNNALQESVGGSCRVSAIRSQIENTLRQFPTVKNVVISINGKTADILQP